MFQFLQVFFKKAEPAPQVIRETRSGIYVLTLWDNAEMDIQQSASGQSMHLDAVQTRTLFKFFRKKDVALVMDTPHPNSAATRPAATPLQGKQA